MKYFKPVKYLNQKQIHSNVQSRKIDPLIQDIQKYSYPISLAHKTSKDLDVGFSSTWQEKCGIAVYTENIVNALKHNGNTVYVYSKNMPPLTFINRMILDNINVLNLQYEPSITYDLTTLKHIILELKKHNIKTIFTVHSEHPTLLKLSNLVDGFLYHKTTTLDLPTEKIFYVPMGVPVFNSLLSKNEMKVKYNLENKKVITTTGFMFTWKQHANVLQEMVPYLQKHPEVIVQLLTSFNSINPTECSIENDNIRSVITSNHLEDRVIHLTSFLPQEELSERLYLSDLGYLWSALTTTSSSAASKEFITSRLPLVVTNSNHYHDMNRGVVKTNIDKAEFIKTIFTTLYSNELDILSKDLESLYQQLNYNDLILKYLEVYNK